MASSAASLKRLHSSEPDMLPLPVTSSVARVSQSMVPLSAVEMFGGWTRRTLGGVDLSIKASQNHQYRQQKKKKISVSN